MKLVTKVGLIAALIYLTGCAQQLEQINKDLANLNQSLAAARSTPSGQAPFATGLAQNTDNGKGTPTQLIVPPDKAAAAALDAALPVAKKVIGIHQCMKDSASSRLLSPYTFPGNENNVLSPYKPIPLNLTQYHDKSKCLGVRSIDQISLVALNTLQIRVVYLAEDSGEASNYRMQFVKLEDASWKIRRIEPLE